MMQWKFQPGARFRSPLARFAATVISVVVIVAIGLFALGALAVMAVVLLVAFAVRRLTVGAQPATPQRAAQAATASASHVIDGDFVVIESPQHTRRTT